MFYFVDHNSFDYTGLITITENRMFNSDYWFLLHDTCKVGPSFLQCVRNFSGNPDKIALKHFPSMNIGLYSSKYLDRMRIKLIEVKNQDYTMEGLAFWKQWGIDNEDYLLWRNGSEPEIYQGGDRWNVIDYENWYGTGQVRRTEYYHALDLYKNKGNWGESKPRVSI